MRQRPCPNLKTRPRIAALRGGRPPAVPSAKRRLSAGLLSMRKPVRVAWSTVGSGGRALARGLQNAGVSRHSALAASESIKNSPLGSVGSQALSLAIGSSLIGIAVGLLVQARLGLTPYDMLSSAIQQKSGLSLGQAGWALAATLFAIAMLLGQRPNKWGVAYILLNGLTIDAASGLLTTPDTFLGRSVFVGAATIVMALGVTIVVESGTSGGPFELLVRAGQERGLNRAMTRSCLDASVFLLGLALGGSFGIATIAYALVFGATLEAVRQARNDLRTGRRARISNLTQSKLA